MASLIPKLAFACCVVFFSAFANAHGNSFYDIKSGDIFTCHLNLTTTHGILKNYFEHSGKVHNSAVPCGPEGSGLCRDTGVVFAGREIFDVEGPGVAYFLLASAFDDGTSLVKLTIVRHDGDEKYQDTEMIFPNGTDYSKPMTISAIIDKHLVIPDVKSVETVCEGYRPKNKY